MYAKMQKETDTDEDTVVDIHESLGSERSYC